VVRTKLWIWYMQSYRVWSQWRTYYECCSKRDIAQTSVKMGELGRLHSLAIIPTSSVLECIRHK